MRELIRICVSRPVAMFMAVIAVFMAGIVCLFKLPVDELPPVETPRVVVSASYPGLPARELRSLVTIPLEDALASAKGLSGIESVSRDGRATIVLDFSWGTNRLGASMRVREAIDSVYPSLPEGAEKPLVLPYDPAGLPIAVVAIRAKSGDLALTRRIAETDLRSRFQRIDGAGSVTISGGLVREALVSADTEKLAALGLTVADLADAVGREHADVPIGSVRQGESELVVVAKGRVEGPSRLGSVRVPVASGTVALSDIAIVATHDAERKSVFAIDGVEGLMAEVYKRPGVSTMDVARGVREAIRDFLASSGSDFEVTLAKDASTAIASRIRALAFSALAGAILAALVLSAFTRDPRASALVAFTIPLSTAATLACLFAAGRGINTMSLGGLSLGIGMMSDNAVVVLDSFRKVLAGRRERPSPAILARLACEVAGSTFASTATTAAVFVPVLFLPGAMGALFGDLAVAVIAAVASSWAFALTVVPAFYRFFDTGKEIKPLPDTLERGYRKFLRKAFRNPVKTFALAFALACAGGALLPLAGAEFMPREDADELLVTADFPPGTDIERVAEAARTVTAALKGNAFLVSSRAWAGAEKDDAARQADPRLSTETLFVSCVLSGSGKRSFAQALASAQSAARAAVSASAKVSAGAPEDVSSVLLGVGGQGRVVKVRAQDPERALAAALSCAERLAAIAGNALSRTEIYPSLSRPELRVVPNRNALAVTGLSFATVVRAARAATDGVVVSRVEENGRDLDIRVMGRLPSSATPRDIASIPAAISKGGPIPLGSIATLSTQYAPTALTRSGRSDVAYLRCFPAEGAGRRLDAGIASVGRERPDAESAEGSAFAQYATTLGITAALVVLILYLILGAQFESFGLPLVMLGTIPLAFAGVGPALLASGSTVNFGSALGFIVLLGVVVNNAIMLYETSLSRGRSGGLGTYAQSACASGACAGGAYVGASDRLRPVLVTVLTNILGVLPIAFAPTGAAQKAMAAAVAGGLAASTALTLFVIPLAFARTLERKRNRALTRQAAPVSEGAA